MAIQRFDYPTAVAPTASLIWTRGAQLNDDAPGMRLNQKISRTAGGVTRVKSYGDPVRIQQLSTIFAMSSLTETDFDDVYDFITDSIIGGVNAFQWTDSNGVVWTVRMLNDTDLSFPKFGHDGQKFVWNLEIVG